MILQRTLPEVVADILIYHGALVEHTGEGSLEVIMPENISRTLGISEHTKFCFSHNEIDDKREGILSVLINLTNMSIQTIGNDTEDIIEKLKASNSHFSIDKSEMVKI